MNDKQWNNRTEKDKKSNNGKQNTAQKTKYRGHEHDYNEVISSAPEGY